MPTKRKKRRYFAPLLAVAGGLFSLYWMFRMRHKALFPLPIQPMISSRFGDTRAGGSRKHEGIDYRAPVGTPLLAPENGQIVWEDSRAGGLGIKLIGDSGFSYWFGHLSEKIAKNGARVERGQLIGKTGSTGKVTGPHLHLQARAPNGERINPESVFVWEFV